MLLEIKLYLRKLLQINNWYSVQSLFPKLIKCRSRIHNTRFKSFPLPKNSMHISKNSNLSPCKTYSSNKISLCSLAHFHNALSKSGTQSMGSSFILQSSLHFPTVLKVNSISICLLKLKLMTNTIFLQTLSFKMLMKKTHNPS